MVVQKSKTNALKQLRAALSENIDTVYQIDEQISAERNRWIQGFMENNQYLQKDAAQNINQIQQVRFDQIDIVMNQMAHYRESVPHQTFIRDKEIRLFREHEIIVAVNNQSYIRDEYNQKVTLLTPTPSADTLRQRLADMGDAYNNSVLILNRQMETYVADYGMRRLLQIPGIQALKERQEQENQSSVSTIQDATKSTLRQKLFAAREEINEKSKVSEKTSVEQTLAERIPAEKTQFTLNENQTVFDTEDMSVTSFISQQNCAK